MNVKVSLLAIVLVASGITGCSAQKGDIYNMDGNEYPEEKRISKTHTEWKAELDPFVYYVTRKKGTERAFTGDYWDNKEAGTYACACCDLPLFSSEDKFKSGTGWPSYIAPIEKENVATEIDTKLGMKRVEILCGRCGAHLGHVFNDGPEPTGLRYCVNSASLEFEPK